MISNTINGYWIYIFILVYVPFLFFFAISRKISNIALYIRKFMFEQSYVENQVLCIHECVSVCERLWNHMENDCSAENCPNFHFFLSFSPQIFICIIPNILNNPNNDNHKNIMGFFAPLIIHSFALKPILGVIFLLLFFILSRFLRNSIALGHSYFYMYFFETINSTRIFPQKPEMKWNDGNDIEMQGWWKGERGEKFHSK